MAKKVISYEIAYTKAADKFFRVHEDVREQYEEAVRKIMSNDHPESVDLKQIQGKREIYYRIRIGNYRVVYTVINGKLIVIKTLLAGPRGDVYKKMGALK